MSLPITKHYGTAHTETLDRRVTDSSSQDGQLAAAERTGCAALRCFGAIASGAYKAIKAVAKFVSWPARAIWTYYTTRAAAMQHMRNEHPSAASDDLPIRRVAEDLACHYIATAPSKEASALVTNMFAKRGIFKIVNLNSVIN